MPQLQRCRDAGDKVLVRLVNLLPTSLAAQGQYVNTWRVQYKVGGLCCLVYKLARKPGISSYIGVSIRVNLYMLTGLNMQAFEDSNLI